MLGILTRYDVIGRITLAEVPLDTPIGKVMVHPVHTLTVEHTAALLTERGLGGKEADLETRLRRWRSDRSPRAEAARPPVSKIPLPAHRVRRRLGAQSPRWRLLGINYYPSPQVDW